MNGISLNKVLKKIISQEVGGLVLRVSALESAVGGGSRSPVSAKITTSRALVTGDALQAFEVEGTADVTLTVNKNQFAKGDWINFLQSSTWQIILEAGTDVTLHCLNVTDEADVKSPGQYGWITLFCLDDTTDAEVFIVIGGVE